MSGNARIGASSWTSPAWSGRFYPPRIPDRDRLSYYAKLYDTVEVDSTYYRDPGPSVFRRWASITPPKFTFAVKFPRDLLDPKEPSDRDLVDQFLANACELGPKLGPVLLQFSPWAKPRVAQGFLERLLDRLDPSIRYSVEVRVKEWFEEPTWSWLRDQLARRRIALTWSYLTYVDVPAERTTDFVYLRFIGDHTTVPDEVHGEIRVDRDAEIALWAKRMSDALVSVGNGFAYFNNHFQGFSPESINLFRRAIGLPPVLFAPNTSTL
ncbi:MAG: DUF72 domain-containing protein [Thermoplasmata archaeon]